MPPEIQSKVVKKKKRGVMSLLVSNLVSPAGSAETMIPPLSPVAKGQVVRLVALGGSDVANGDGVSSEIILQVTENGSSFSTVRRIAVTGSTYTERLDKTWESDGNLRFRLICKNNGGAKKRISAWIDGFKKVST